MWPPGPQALVPLTDNVRNSKPIAAAVGQFLVEQQSVSQVAGTEPEVIVCPAQQVAEQGLQRVQRLLTEEQFGANEVLVVGVTSRKRSSFVLPAGSVSTEST